ncbi:hypothetical protein THAOC_28292 [Thalassiosira oceanica]|uniref:Uncharacterized protein n=1 Tax=Thalassiosira oceanica TaxID=159749 RepID=K0RFB9_THAOC|nr:hypothetical protein THAOC_28292 [Thalassiosira oceanica]|eukprot:EJK52428.1 hypothetical protein THAOC_28292 [Thalassiosira oceanica]
MVLDHRNFPETFGPDREAAKQRSSGNTSNAADEADVRTLGEPYLSSSTTQTPIGEFLENPTELHLNAYIYVTGLLHSLSYKKPFCSPVEVTIHAIYCQLLLCKRTYISNGSKVESTIRITSSLPSIKSDISKGSITSKEVPPRTTAACCRGMDAR